MANENTSTTKRQLDAITKKRKPGTPFKLKISTIIRARSKTTEFIMNLYKRAVDRVYSYGL